MDFIRQVAPAEANLEIARLSRPQPGLRRPIGESFDQGRSSHDFSFIPASSRKYWSGMAPDGNAMGTKPSARTHTSVVSGMRSELNFEGLVREHYPSLYRFALSLTRNETDACDLVQQTFYLWASKGHQLDDPSKVKSWLFTTLHREFLGSRRRRVRFPHHELDEVQAELPEVLPELPTHLDWEILNECLAQMDPTFQAPVCLFYLEDYSYDGIAEVLDIPLGTVKSRISRGVAQLQRLVTKRFAPTRPLTKTSQ